MRAVVLGDSTLCFDFGPSNDAEAGRRARIAAEHLRRQPLPGLIDATAAFSSVTVVFDPIANSGIDAQLAECLARLAFDAAPRHAAPPSRHEIPTCYDAEFAPDLSALLERTGLTHDALVELHASQTYVVQAVGFLPGFAYLGPVPEPLRVPRLATPRPRVPAGSVALGAAYTGIYPCPSPGGWHLIGRAPVELFNATRTPAALFAVGDRVAFRPVSRRELKRWT